MASEFIGYKILVTLKGQPPMRRLRGKVADVIDQKLVLKDVILSSNGQYLPSYHIDSSTIADLEIVPPQHTTPHGETYSESRHLENQHPVYQKAQEYAHPKQAPPPPFVDPAILSFAKPSLNTMNTSSDSQWSRHSQHDTFSPVMIADSIKQDPKLPILPQKSQSAASTVRIEGMSRTMQDRSDSSAAATLTRPFDFLDLNEEQANVASSNKKQGISPSGTVKRSKGNADAKLKGAASQPTSSTLDPRDGQSLRTTMRKPSNKGKGWRQTPFIEDTSPAKAKAKRRRPRQGGQKSYLEDTNGWATEDATDIHDLGEFDFEHNLSKFDKRRVFDDIGKDDKIAEHDRLVNFNRNIRPGTNGGRNLHYAENVLDMPDTKARPWQNSPEETEDEELVAEKYSSGRTSRRDHTRRPPPSQKASLLTAKQASMASPINGPVSSFRASLRVALTNKPCTCVTPLQMLEIEQLCTSELGLTDEMLYENAGRGIAELALTLPSEFPANPIILFLVGNHKSGCRAIAAARHLRNHNIRVSICILGGEREHMLLESLKRQLDIYRKSGGWLLRWDEFQSKLSSVGSSTSSSDGAAPDLIVDALLGTHVTFSELRTDDQAIAFEMIRWTNRSPVPILSIDVPSGLHAASGEVTTVDSTPLIIHATFIACIGAPKIGLTVALGSGEGRSRDWRRLSVVDMGISNVAWKKYGTRRRHGVDFGKHWVVPLKVVGTGVGAGDRSEEGRD